MQYKVAVTEILCKEVMIEAESEEAAYHKARQMWKDEKIVLTGENLQDTQFEIEG